MKKIAFFLLILPACIYCFGLQAQEEVMQYNDLQTFLPQSINGYEAGEPDGQTTTMQGLSFSSAEIKFTKESGDYVRITLLDYSGAVSMYKAATAMWNSGMSFENNETMAKTVHWSDDIVGWEEFRKKENVAKLALGIGERFFLTVEADNQNGMDFVKQVAKDMKLEELATQ